MYHLLLELITTTPGDWDKKVAFTYVYAAELSVKGVLDGIKRGRVIISCGPWLSLRGLNDKGQESVGIGDILHTSNPQINLSVSWKDVPDNSELLVHTKEDVNHKIIASGSGSQDIELKVLDNDSIWLELYAQDGSLLAITNPIYIERK